MTTQDFTSQLLAHMGIEPSALTFHEDEEASVLSIQVEDQDSGLLIGRHAETIESLQRIIRLVCQKDGDKPVHVNVNDFRERREERVVEIARTVAARVVESGRAQTLRLPANERRIVHMSLRDFAGIKTESHGEGRERVLEIKPITD